MWKVHLYSGFRDVPPQDWQACIDGSNPFVQLEFLLSLEISGCAVPGTGWQAVPIIVYDAQGQAWAACPAYIKSHSVGEFVFDYSWADAFHRLGGHYYPKLLVGIPFTPVPGPRLLINPQATAEQKAQLCEILGRYLVGLVEELGLSSAHCTFCPGNQVDQWSGRWLHRLGLQFHWENPGYNSFDDFLAQLSARKRKSVKKERQQAQSHGLVLETVTGDQLQEQHWDAFWKFYVDTTSRKWGDPHLNREFFRCIHERMPDQIVLMLARRGPEYVAGALNLCSSREVCQRGQGVLFGRNWGCLDQFPCLHFELCYYQALDYAIANGLIRVEAGAQGMHKVARGYLPVETHSLHFLTEPPIGPPRFISLIERFLSEERVQIREAAQEILEGGPFRKETGLESEVSPSRLLEKATFSEL